RWMGKCTNCDTWNSLVEEVKQPKKQRHASLTNESMRPIKINEVKTESGVRLTTSIAEFDRVLGGGVVPGSLVLIGGDPGIGKSTLLLQISSRIASKKLSVLYVSGEESTEQTKLRADRLDIKEEALYILAETNLHDITHYIKELKPTFVVIDSIQTMFKEEITSAPGSVSQVRECTMDLMKVAKTNNIPIFIVGHVTKEGAIAGP